MSTHRTLSAQPIVAPDAPGQAERDASGPGLYVHVPFCAVRCDYCDFSTGTLSAAKVERYLVAIEHELKRRAPSADGIAFRSVFFGGGTPSTLSSRHFRRLWTLLRDHLAIAPDAEITLEANPETVRESLLETWAAAGVNRLSMGAQSFDPHELRSLGRIHDAERPGIAIAMARRTGFKRLSLDLMFGYPGHTANTWAHTLERALEIGPEHLSAYCFIPEDGTPLGVALLRGEQTLPSNEQQAERYAELQSRLEAAGYAGYETSNFARPGAACRHNLVYWLRREYLALGPSAHGLWGGVRYGNHYAFEAWASALERGEACDAIEVGSADACADEIVMLALRLGSGLQEHDHAPEHWRGVMARYAGALAHAVTTGRLEPHGGGWRVARQHRFVADDVIAWLMARADTA